MPNNKSGVANFLEGYDESAMRGDEETIREYHRILGMQQERGDQLARLYLADEIVKLRRALATKSNEDSHAH